MITGKTTADSDGAVSKRFRTSTKLIAFILAFLMLGVTITAFTQRESSSGIRVQLCVKPTPNYE
jgi:hypothetical protein